MRGDDRPGVPTGDQRSCHARSRAAPHGSGAWGRRGARRDPQGPGRRHPTGTPLPGEFSPHAAIRYTDARSRPASSVAFRMQSGTETPPTTLPPMESPGRRASSARARSTKRPWPTSYCGMARGQRRTWATTGAARVPSARRELGAHQARISRVVVRPDLGVGAPAREGRQRDVARGRATGEERRREQAAEDPQRLAARREEAEPVERMGDVLAAEAERREHDGRVGHLVEEARLARRRLVEQPWRNWSAGTARTTRRAVRAPSSVSTRNVPSPTAHDAPAGRAGRGRRACPPRAARAGRRGPGRIVIMWPLGAGPLRFARAPLIRLPCSVSSAWIFAVAQRTESRSGSPGVHARHERPDGVVEHLAAEPAPHEVGDALVAARPRGGRTNGSRRMRAFADGREEPRAEEGAGPAGRGCSRPRFQR